MPLFKKHYKVKKALLQEIENRTVSLIAHQKDKIIEVKGKINAGTLNIRKKPDLNAKVIGQLKRGDVVDILNDLGHWYQIIIRNEKFGGYVYKKYVQITRQEKSGIITTRRLNVRSVPSTSGEILGVVKKNEAVNILKELTDWLQIKYYNKVAYIYKQYVELSNVPIKINPIAGTTSFFYQRKDLADHQLSSNNKITPPKGYHEAIAARTWNNYGGLIQKISSELQIDVATALSVLCVESSGKGFKDDKMIIRFENHVMDMFWGKKNENKFEEHFKYDRKSRRNGHYYRKSKKDKWITCHSSQQTEWDVLDLAMTLNETAALKSISMGAPQIMGFNHKFIGYKSPQEMFKMFNKDIRYHLLALFDFCKYKPERIRYLQRRNFYKFSVEYNGTAAPEAYEKRLKKYYNIYRELLNK